jgi:hypothetical protein
MARRPRIIPVALLCSVINTFVVAGEPQYLIPRTTPRVITHHPLPEAKAATGQMLEAQPYAYGWFGAQPRRHWSRHFGYYRTYTEWSAK